jgi:hypothetical protein
MEAIGWEITPAGWILLLILSVLVAGYIIQWLQHRSDENT